ncbi:unnamed protein product, partial [Amoebophrya sp. A120]
SYSREAGTSRKGSKNGATAAVLAPAGGDEDPSTSSAKNSPKLGSSASPDNIKDCSASCSTSHLQMGLTKAAEKIADHVAGRGAGAQLDIITSTTHDDSMTRSREISVIQRKQEEIL